MQFEFENYGSVGSGNFPDFIEFFDSSGELFYVSGGEIFGKPSTKLNGSFASPNWVGDFKVSNDTGVEDFNVNVLSGFGLIGSYSTPTAQKMIIYEFELDVTRYLTNGSISQSADTVIHSFSLELENPKNESRENMLNAIVSEDSSLFSPGAKVVFRFSVGDSEEFDVGSFFVDRSDFELKRNTVSVDGRSRIGKVLKDQTINEMNVIGNNTITNILGSLFDYAGLTEDDYYIAQSTELRSFTFDQDKDLMDVFDVIMQSVVNWRIEDRPDGVIVVGGSDFDQFSQNGIYTFMREKDIFSRKIVRDDQNAYRRVCIHNGDWSIAQYRDVSTFIGWSLSSNKTLFIEVPQGTSSVVASSIADDLAVKLGSVGKIETFTGSFRPYLQVGDGAEIVSGSVVSDLGVITEITHYFGKDGYFTNFSVDSGGRVGTGRIKDYIDLIVKNVSKGVVSYE